MTSRNISSLTGLRGFAAWFVVLYHFRESMVERGSFSYLSEMISYGYLAVDLFFLLSGFVLAYNSGAEFDRLKLRNIGAFYVRRIARIYPLHIFILILFTINPIAILIFSNSGEIGVRYGVDYFILSVFLIQNWGFSKELAWNIPAWSISTEFASYLLFPFGAFLMRKWPALILAFLCFFLIFILQWIYRTSGYISLGSGIAELGVYRCILQFFIGMALGFISIELLNSRTLISKTSMLLFICAVFVLWNRGNSYPFIIIPLSFSLLILYLLDEKALVSRLLSLKIFVFLGEISYSTYLIHYFIKDWMKFLSSELGYSQLGIYLIAVLVSSVFLYRMVEMPCRARAVNMFGLNKFRS